MKKNIIITLAVIVVVFLTAAVSFAVGSGAVAKKEKPSDYKVGIKYEKALESDKPMIALMYVDWCGYCFKFMPKFQELSKVYGSKFNFVMLNAEAPENQALVQDVALTGFPTMYIIDPKYDNRVLLNNAIYQDMSKIRAEFDRYARIRGLLDKASK